MDVRHRILVAALLAAVAGIGCGAAEAQEKVVWEHGVLEWIRWESAKEHRERFSWATAAEEIQRDSALGLFGAIGLQADQRGSSADRLSILDFLSKGGWVLVNRTDVTFTNAGGSAIAEHYMLRRRR
ncbi:MAG TPA: hypothetical protein VFY93_12255 [Planctomycetota bacterium]|nr:hypothetical protein [Planctomycetota bacterium]